MIASDDGFDIVIEPKRSVGHDWKDLWKFRGLFYFLSWRDLLVRYKQTAIGIAWSVIRPLLTLVVFTVALWAVLGPHYNYSEGWQLVINSGTTIVTFPMVFMIQQTQKDNVALHLKLNELIAANKHASNHMVGIEDLDEQDFREVASMYVRLAARAKHRREDK